jgi:hypothetical protein
MIDSDLTAPVAESTPKKFTVTLFKDDKAKDKWQRTMTLAELAERVERTSAPTKDETPWLKLAVFGDARSYPAGCLRTNDNVLSLGGIVAEHDASTLTMDEAAELLRSAGIEALLYTSPSATPTKHKWRVVCPFSQPRKKDLHARMVFRIDRALGGTGVRDRVLAHESWTLSLAYHYGRAEDNADACHHAMIIEGTPLDLIFDAEEAAGKFELDKVVPISRARRRTAEEDSDAPTVDLDEDGPTGFEGLTDAELWLDERKGPTDEMLAKGAGKGKRHPYINTLAGVLFAHLDNPLAEVLVQLYAAHQCDPPFGQEGKEKRELEDIIDWFAKRECGR